jgi:hypothetical protein
VTTETTLSALLFAAVFLFGGQLHPLRWLNVDRRAIVSFGAGMAAAYVFVHLMPELAGAREAFASSASIALRYEGMAIYFLALIGFLLFYALEHMRRRMQEGGESRDDARAFRVHLGGFAAYVCLVGYLLMHSLEESPVSTTLFAVAIAFHFLGIDHELREQHGERYERTGRYLMAGAASLGWGLGLLGELPRAELALLVAFVSGAVIMNSAVMELPTEKEGRFLPFFGGGIVYALILLPLG